MEDRFSNWLKKELVYRKGLQAQAKNKEEANWYKAQAGILSTVIKELPCIGMPIPKEMTQEDIAAMADEAYHWATYTE